MSNKLKWKAIVKNVVDFLFIDRILRSLIFGGELTNFDVAFSERTPKIVKNGRVTKIRVGQSYIWA